MLNTNAHLSTKVFADDIETAPTRDGFGRGAVEAGKTDSRIVVLCADLAESTRADWFQKEFPDRFVEVGIAEQNMVGIASGMALAGKIPFVASYAAFNPGRNYEQIRTMVALNNLPIKVCGMHAGVSVGPDGATHQMLEDIGLMRLLPNMTVIAPGDAEEARKAVMLASQTDGPVYLRFARSATPVFTTPATPFEIGKALLVWEGNNPKVGILSTGALTYQALLSARALSADGIESVVLHIPTIKPLDREAILSIAKRVQGIVTIEEHQSAGGFGSAVAELLAKHHPLPMRFVGVEDEFGQSGTPEELLSYYKLDASHIVDSVQSLLS
jgi:transketolase